MRLVSFRTGEDGAGGIGAVLDQEVAALQPALAAAMTAAGEADGAAAALIPADMTAFLALGAPALVAAARAAAFAARPEQHALRRPLSSVTLLAPVPKPGK